MTSRYNLSCVKRHHATSFFARHRSTMPLPPGMPLPLSFREESSRVGVFPYMTMSASILMAHLISSFVPARLMMACEFTYSSGFDYEEPGLVTVCVSQTTICKHECCKKFGLQLINGVKDEAARPSLRLRQELFMTKHCAAGLCMCILSVGLMAQGCKCFGRSSQC